VQSGVLTVSTWRSPQAYSRPSTHASTVRNKRVVQDPTTPFVQGGNNAP